MANLGMAIFNFVLTGCFMVLMIICLNLAVKALTNKKVKRFMVDWIALVFCFSAAAGTAILMCIHIGDFIHTIF